MSDDEFIVQTDVAEVVPEVDSLPPQDVEGDDGEPEIPNNATTYFDKHEDSVFLIASHPTLPLVVSGGGDNLAYLWTTHGSQPKLVATLDGHTESVVAGEFSSDGKFLVTGDMEGGLQFWRSEKGGEKWELISRVQEVEEIEWVKWHPTLPIAAAGALDGSIWVYEVSSSEAENLAVLNGHSLPTTCGVFLPGHELLRLVSVADDAQIICWDVYAGQTIYKLGPLELRGEHPWVNVVSSPTGNTYAASSQDGWLVVVKADNGQLLQNIEVVDPETTERKRSLEGLDWSKEAQIIAVGSVAGEVKLYDVATWRVRSTFTLEDAITSLAFVPGTKLLVVASMDGTVSCWDAVTGQRVFQGTGHSEGILGFALQNQGRRIITAGDEGVCLVYNIDS